MPPFQSMLSRLSASATLVALIALAGGCATTHPHQRTLDAYLAARQAGDIDAARRHLAPDARIWFGEKTGPGRPKTLTGGWGAWDIEMHAVNTYDDVAITDETIAATFHERNDFSRLIGFPGWRSRSTFWLDEHDRISEQLYEPLPQHPPQSACFDAPLEWARQHRPDVLAEIYPDDQFAPSTETARRWRELLIDWRTDTGLPIPEAIRARAEAAQARSSSTSATTP